MNERKQRVTDASSLQKAIDEKMSVIEVEGSITALKSINLPAGIHLRGIGADASLLFNEGQPGLLLSANHDVRDLRVETDVTQVAIGLADDADDLGTLSIRDMTTVGRFHLEASRAKRGLLTLRNIHVERADARLAAHRPAGFGVEVLLGGITVYNASKDSESRWSLEAHDLSGGSKDQPLQGSGVFIFGGAFIPVDADMSGSPAPTQQGGTIELSTLTVGEVHIDGGIPNGIGNLITGGVFVGSGVHAKAVVNDGPATTYGANDMVLENWGTVDTWTAKAAIVSRGPSGIGFVNFGNIGALKIDAPIETHGVGARGFNLYDGALKSASFRSITTHGDGAIGIQLSKPFGRITVEQDVRTRGGEGDSLVKGKVVHLEAHAISLKSGTKGDAIIVGGKVVAEDAAVADWDLEAPAGVIGQIEVGGQKLPMAGVAQ